VITCSGYTHLFRKYHWDS